MKWIALFSQTGSEILQISKKRERFPDKVITNSQDWDKISPELLKLTTIDYVDKVPTVDQYLNFLPEDALITLHGWLRIIPGEVCENRNIINGHPGLITLHPELKGKDPQEKAFNLKHETGGCVIHKAIAEVDAGSIVSEGVIPLTDLTLDEVYSNLHDLSVDLWVDYLNNGERPHLNVKVD
jgi:methionyl-tRNA formyltransferase